MIKQKNELQTMNCQKILKHHSFKLIFQQKRSRNCEQECDLTNIFAHRGNKAMFEHSEIKKPEGAIHQNDVKYWMMKKKMKMIISYLLKRHQNIFAPFCHGVFSSCHFTEWIARHAVDDRNAPRKFLLVWACEYGIWLVIAGWLNMNIWRLQTSYR